MENQKVVNVIRTAIEQETESGARIKLTPGVVDTASGYLCSAYLRTDELAEDIHVPAGMHLTAGDYISVGQLDNTFWVDRLLPQNDYAELEIDWNTGEIFAGANGTVAPAKVLQIDPNAMWPSGTSFDFGASTAPLDYVYAKKVNGGNTDLYIDAPAGSDVRIGNDTADYVWHGTHLLPSAAGTLTLGNAVWLYNGTYSKYHYAQGDGAEGYVVLRRDVGVTASAWQTQGIIAFQAYDGNDYHTIANIRGVTEAGVADENVEGRITFWVANDSGVLTQYFVMTKDGYLFPVADEAQRIGYQNGGAFENVVSRNILPANTGTPSTNSSIGSSASVWHHTFTENIKSTGDIHFYPDGSTSYDVLVSNDGIKPRVDGAMHLGTDAVRFGSAYFDEVHTASPYVWEYTVTGSPHTWTKPAHLAYIKVEVLGAGGGGGGADNTTSTEGASAGGGGGGGYAVSFFKASDLPSTCTATVGTGGSVGANTGGDGGTGGTSTFAGTGITTLTGTGGGGGSGDAGGTGRSIQNGGSVGAGSGGNAMNLDGEPGWHGDRFSLSGVSAATGAASGRGGGVAMGYGFSGRWDSTGDAYEGTGYGAGGTGSYNHNSGSQHQGGGGRNGVIFVTEYYA